MVFLVIVCIDSYLYTRKKMPTPLYGGCPPSPPPTIIFLALNPIETHNPCMTYLKCHTHDGDFLLDQMI
jgi:hypothetical protein